MNHYIVYLSSATQLFSDDDLTSILNISRINNSKLNVTGILLYCDGNILQVLEGEKNIIRELFAKIEKDLRHKNIIKMVEGENAERSFPDWSMGFKAVCNTEWKEYEGYLQLNTSLLLSLISKKNSKIDVSLKSFINTNVQ